MDKSLFEVGLSADDIERLQAKHLDNQARSQERIKIHKDKLNIYGNGAMTFEQRVKLAKILFRKNQKPG